MSKQVHFDDNNRPTPEYLDRVSKGILRGNKERRIPEELQGELEVW